MHFSSSSHYFFLPVDWIFLDHTFDLLTLPEKSGSWFLHFPDILEQGIWTNEGFLKDMWKNHNLTVLYGRVRTWCKTESMNISWSKTGTDSSSMTTSKPRSFNALVTFSISFFISISTWSIRDAILIEIKQQRWEIYHIFCRCNRYPMQSIKAGNCDW